MDILKIEYLNPKYEKVKSYYLKASIKYLVNGDIILQSYNTDIATLTKDGIFTSLDKISRTSKRHLNEFKKQFENDIKVEL